MEAFAKIKTLSVGQVIHNQRFHHKNPPHRNREISWGYLCVHLSIKVNAEKGTWV